MTKTTTYRKLFSLVSEYGQLALGILLASIGLKAFLLPNGFLDGGVTGIAILISEKTNLDISWLLVLLSIPFFVLAHFTVSRKIIVKSIISLIGLAVSIHFETFTPITEDKLLIAIFGGLFLGAGIGVSIRNGSVLDGSEILGVYLNDRFGVSIGRVVLIFNVVLFSVTALVLSVEVAMYSILTYLVTGKVIDFIIEGFEDFIGVMIISEQPRQIETAIIEKVGSGMTIFKGEKGFGSSGQQQDFPIIQTIINRIDIRKIHRVVDEVDPDAFVIEFDINSIKGGVLRRYLDRKNDRRLSMRVFDDQTLQFQTENAA